MGCTWVSAVMRPLFEGEYGGFMILDVTAHAQHRISGKLFAERGGCR